MKNVTRGPLPDSLKLNAQQWAKDLLDAINSGGPVSKTIQSRYNQADVRAELKSMYDGLCCYCEAPIGVVSFEHIEHRKPKSRFPELAFNWDNLHLSCQKCNVAKGNRWDDENPILDATANESVDQHLTYEADRVHGIKRTELTYRGKTTIEHTDLNRNELKDVRASIVFETIRLVSDLNESEGKPRYERVKTELSVLCRLEFGSLIAWYLRCMKVQR